MEVDAESNFDDALCNDALLTDSAQSMSEESTYSSILLTRSPMKNECEMSAENEFQEDMSLPEIERLEEYIHYLEMGLSQYDSVQAIEDLRKDSSFDSSYDQEQSGESFPIALDNDDIDYDHDIDIDNNENDKEEEADWAAREAEEDLQRLIHYEKCMSAVKTSCPSLSLSLSLSQSPLHALYLSPYVSPSHARTGEKSALDEELLRTPLRVQAILQVIGEYEKRERQRGGEGEAERDTETPYVVRRVPQSITPPRSQSLFLSLRATSFFHSALDGEDSPSPSVSLSVSSSPSPSLPSRSVDEGVDPLLGIALASGEKALSLSLSPSAVSHTRSGGRGGGRGEFTMLSLKRNWELEDEISDDGEGEGEGDELQDRSSPVTIPFTAVEGVLNSPERRAGVERSLLFSEGEREGEPLPLSLSLDMPVASSRHSKVRIAQHPHPHHPRPTPGVGRGEGGVGGGGGGAGAGVEKDLRLHGDFSVWSNGRMLSPLSLHGEYVGLSPSLATHLLSQGRLVALSAAIQDALHASTENNSNNTNNNNNALLRQTLSYAEHVNDSLALQNGQISAQPCYVSHTVECVLRPDVEINAIMRVVAKLAKHFRCKCVLQKRAHVVLFHDTESVFSEREKEREKERENGSESATQRESTQSAEREWDALDLQICVSRELRQRVVLMQFLKRTTRFSSAMFAGTVQYVPLSRCPATRKLVSLFKKELIHQELTLSCLYAMDLDKVCALSKGLDTHYLAQLHSFCRENMLQKLSINYKGMQEHLREQTLETKTFLETLDPILRQYGCAVPEPWSRKRLGKKILEHQVNEERKIVEIMRSEAIISRLQDFELDLAALRSPDKEDQHTHTQEFETSSVSENTPLPHTPERTKARFSPENNEKNTSTEESAASSASPMSSPVMRKYRSELETSHEALDGMTMCLMMLDKCYQSLVESCDSEYSQRVQQRNSTTILLIQDMMAYKREALQQIMSFPDIQTTSTMKSFQQTFQGVSARRETDLLEERRRETALAQAQAATKPSWFQKIQTGFTLVPTTTTNSVPSSESLHGKTKTERESESPTAVSPTAANPTSPVKRELPFRISRAVVLYYCSGLVGSVPGTLYVTQSHVCLSSSVLGFNAKREVFCLEHLTEIALLSNNNSNNTNNSSASASAVSTATAAAAEMSEGHMKKSGVDSSSSVASNLFKSNTLRLTFYYGVRDVLVTPLAVDCLRVKAMMEFIKQQFALPP